MLLGNGDGTFQFFQPAAHYNTGSFPAGAVTADFNGDGKPDLATTNHYSNSITVLLNIHPFPTTTTTTSTTESTNTTFTTTTEPQQVLQLPLL